MMMITPNTLSSPTLILLVYITLTMLLLLLTTIITILGTTHTITMTGITDHTTPIINHIITTIGTALTIMEAAIGTVIITVIGTDTGMAIITVLFTVITTTITHILLQHTGTEVVLTEIETEITEHTIPIVQIQDIILQEPTPDHLLMQIEQQLQMQTDQQTVA